MIRTITRKSARRPQAGFTLVELMTAIAVTGTLFFAGAPSLTGLLNTNKLATQANTLMHSIHIARSEAIKRNTRVTLRKTGRFWEEGWIAFVDANANAELDDGEEVLVTQTALPPGLFLTGNRSVEDYISYTGRGRSERVSGAFQAGRLMLCDTTLTAEPAHARAIVISSSGRPRISKNKRDLRSCSKNRA